METRNGEYWISTDNGLSRFHPIAMPGGWRFENFRLGSAEGANQVSVLLEDSEDNIWCGTAAGLYRLRRSAKEIRPEFIALDPGRTTPVSALLEDPRRRLWIGSGDSVWVRSQNGRATRMSAGWDGHQGISAMILDRHGRLWIGGFGLSAFRLDADPPTLVAHYPVPVLALCQPANGDDISISARSLIRFRPDAPPRGRFQPFSTSPLLSRHHISSLAIDSQDNLWMGISNLGAGRISREPIELFSDADGLESPIVVGVMESRRGVLFAVSGARRSLNKFTGSRFVACPRRQPPGVPDPGWGHGQITLQDHSGEWWFVSSAGVLRYPASDDARSLATAIPRVYTKRNGLPHEVILRLFEDSRGDIWAGTASGIARWNRATDRWTSYAPPATSTQDFPAVHSIAEDHTGAIWVGFNVPGLLRIRGSQTGILSKGVPRGFINALLADSRGRLWIGSSQGGLGRVDDPAAPTPGIRIYTLDQGLSSEHVFSLAEDRWGRIYIAGGRGVDRLDPESGAIRHFTEANGLPSGETERLYSDHNGSVWFASNFGLARYDPEPDHVVTPAPPLLRSIRIAGTPHPVSVLGELSVSGLELSAGQNQWEVEYRSLPFTVGERLRYQYRLAGASREWSAPTEIQTVHYANLSPGAYKFEVRSLGETGLVSAPAFVEFRLLPPIWRRGWFIGLAATLLASAMYALHRYRLNHVLAVERVRTRLATDLHDDLGAGLAEIAILTEVAKRKPADSAAEMLDQVAERARGLRAALADIVWTVDPRSDRLSDLVRRMRQTALSMLETDERRVQFIAPAEEQLESTGLSPQLRRHLLLFFKEAVTNIARHAGASDVHLEITARGHQLQMLIRDNGRGFDLHAPATGRGLASLRYRPAEMRGELRLDSEPGQGSVIELRVPLPA